MLSVPKRIYQWLVGRVKALLSRRPHRSFRPTRRRDYARSFKLPGYWSFTAGALKVIKQNWKSLLWLAIIYGTLSAIFLGLSSQESFADLREDITQTGSDLLGGDWSTLGKSSALAVVTVGGAISPDLTVEQQIYAVAFGLLAWLTVVWLIRHRLAGNRVSLRDALYNAGAPVVATTVLFIIFIIQLIPVALAALGFTAAQATGLLDGGIEAMLFWFAAVGLVALSLYWASGTAIAMVIVTNPGTYPLKALSIAGDMVTGRRLRVIFRLLWLIMLVAIAWLAILIPAIAFDGWLKNVWSGVDWLPIVPGLMLALSIASFIFMANYIYLLYRRLVDDDAKPA